MRCYASIHEFFDRLIQLIDGLLVTGLHGIGQAVVDVVFQDDLCGVIERRAHGRKLDEHLSAVAPVLYVTIEPAVYYKWRFNDGDMSRFGVKIGFGFYL